MISVIWKLTHEERIDTLQQSLCSVTASEEETECIVVLGPDVVDVHSEIDATCMVDTSGSLTTARNRGARAASGDYVAFMDSDAVPHAQWVDRIADGFDHADMVGGPLIPSRDTWLPKAWHWLIGCGPHYDEPQVVPNTYGSNFALTTEAFESVGGFDESMGAGSDGVQQAAETKLAREARQQGYEGVWYDPQATVTHVIPAHRTNLLRTIQRAYEQGKAKCEIGVDERETQFLTEELLPEMKSKPRTIPVSAALTMTVACGYLRGKL